MRYEIKLNRSNLPELVFAEERHKPIAEFFLAEGRNFGEEILAALTSVTNGGKSAANFAGNVFSLTITPERTTIDNDITGAKCTADTTALAQVAADYAAACRSEN